MVLLVRRYIIGLHPHSVLPFGGMIALGDETKDSKFKVRFPFIGKRECVCACVRVCVCACVPMSLCELLADLRRFILTRTLEPA